MAKANATWKVLPHAPIEKLSDRLWRVEGDLVGVPMKRVMAVARRDDGSLVIHNGIALEDEAMREIDAWGKVSMIIVPNGYHRMDAKVFHERYPDAKIVCPAGSRKKVEEVVPVTATYDEVAADGAVELATLDGTKQREGLMLVRGADGTSLVLNDAVFNMPHQPGVKGFVLRRLTGSSGGPKVSRIMKMLAIADRAAFRAHLERLAETPGLRRILVAHHQTIDVDPASVLRGVAATL